MSIQLWPCLDTTDFCLKLMHFLEKLLLLLQEDPTPNSVHEREDMNLERLQSLVRRYNQLCTQCPTLVLTAAPIANAIPEN